MAQHDYSLANQSGSSFRSDLNNALAAIVSQNSGSAEPTTKYAYQYWVDTSTTPALIKQRNAANSDWITLGEVDGQTLAADGTLAKPGISFAADINTGLRRNAADDISIVTGGTQAITVNSSQRVGIGNTSPVAKLDITGDIYLRHDGSGEVSLDIGRAPTGNQYAYIDLIGDTTYTDYGLRIIRSNTGANTTSQIIHRGTGNLELIATDGADIVTKSGTAQTARMKASNGQLILGGTASQTSVGHSLVTSGRIQSNATYSNTTSSSADVAITSTGLLVRSISSARYKTNVETLEDSYADAVLNARPVYFNSIASDDTAHPEWSYWGFIAEEVAEIDPRLVRYSEDDDGNLQAEGVQYDRFVPHLINLVKRQKDQIADLTARIEALEAAG